MTLDILIVFALIIVAVIFFVSEKISFDVTAVLISGALMASGILTVKEGLSGFSNPATITIGAMFIISAGFRQTGALRAIGSFFERITRRNGRLGIVVVLLIVGVISAFINNTAAVAIFIPVFIAISIDMGKSPSRLLMPLSFISMFGGACTLLGTSTNILVSSLARDNGLEGFSMFEFAPMGLIFAVAGVVYLLVYGAKKIPAYESAEDLTEQYRMDGNIYDLELKDGCEHIGKPLRECILTEDLDLDVLRVFRGDESEGGTRTSSKLRKGDVLRMRGSSEEIDRVKGRDKLVVRPSRKWKDADLARGRDVLVEVSLAPDSGLIGKTISNIDFMKKFGAFVLAIRHNGRLIKENYGDVRLAGGDSLLLSMERERLPSLEEDADFLVVSRVELKKYRTRKIIIAASVLAAVVTTAALNILPIVVSAVLGCLVLVLTGSITTRQAYNAVQWKVIFLLAGVLPLGVAMSKTGAAGLLADWVLKLLKPMGPTAVLSGFFLLAMLLTNIISNQASAALLAPIVINAAQSLSVNPRTFLLAVTFAASLSFITPVGYQTNTMIYNTGRYRFKDFLRIGLPLSMILWVVGSLVIPIIWPF